MTAHDPQALEETSGDSPSKVKKIHTIAHTHWDYEWYFTQNESQIQLDYHMDELLYALDSNLLQSYLLDGQTSLIEDHLSNCPQNREAIERQVADKRLLIGPWYTQSDLMIVAGESIVKNLQTGYHYAEAMGHSMDIAYVPDSFGQSQDMPKIFNGFGLTRFVFWRGLSSSKSAYREFLWQSEDGSQLTCYNIREGYYPGGALIWGNENDIRATADTNSQASHFDFGVFPVGGDQRYVDFDFKEKIAKANREVEEYEFVESDYRQVFEDIDTSKLNTIQGEMLDSENSKIHRSIYSSRYDHKYMNDRVERKLINTLEPLMAMGSALGLEHKRGTVDNIWKGVLKNHAHDSACGCNTDKTNYQILNRFINADERIDAHIDYLIRKISEATPEDSTLTLFNTLAYRSDKKITATISTKKPCFDITLNGQSIPFEVEDVRKVYNGSIKRDESENDPELYYHEIDIAFRHSMKPLSYCNLRVEEGVQELSVTRQELTLAAIEDNDYKLAVINGQLNLKEKSTGRLLKNFITLVDQADDGDTYDYSPLAGDEPLVFDFTGAEFSAEADTLTQTLKIRGCVELPEGIEGQERSETFTKLPYTLQISLENKGQVQCRLLVDNTCKDHRLRVRIDTGIASTSSFSDTPFGCIERPVRQTEMDNWQELGWNEEPTGIYPMLNIVNLHDDQSSVTAFTRGIKEYEITGDQGQFIELTAFRSVGWLGKPGLQRRPGKASGNEFRYIPAPDSQLLQTLECEFAISLDSEFRFAELRRRQQDWTTPVLHYQKQELNRFTGPLKYFVSNRMRRDLDSQFQLFRKIELSDHLVSSLFKLADDGRSYVLRLLNVSNEQQVKANIEFNTAPKQLTETDLAERTQLGFFDNTIDLDTMKPGEIKTFLIELF
ncbi:glycoside hydrolase family 38 N-terminal domain-containing protein [Endozoicomonas numazuensis]|uniref:glycoside hydrolase family 38 N-terminal domain-containing protein n=1 Tax=Endozoicomonas numazuensis TaxID=1137799 RepID=UPI00068E124A|nr:glycoside hydrolase family 38 C-terminal domain-containing protein [Endozoicomonas numazuensis]